MDKTIKILAEVSGKSLRLDKFLAEKIKTLTRSQIKKIINSKGVRVNKKIVISASEKVKDRSEITRLAKTGDIAKISLGKYTFLIRFPALVRLFTVACRLRPK